MHRERRARSFRNVNSTTLAHPTVAKRSCNVAPSNSTHPTCFAISLNGLFVRSQARLTPSRLRHSQRYRTLHGQLRLRSGIHADHGHPRKVLAEWYRLSPFISKSDRGRAFCERTGISTDPAPQDRCTRNKATPTSRLTKQSKPSELNETARCRDARRPHRIA